MWQSCYYAWRVNLNNDTAFYICQIGTIWQCENQMLLGVKGSKNANLVHGVAPTERAYFRHSSGYRENSIQVIFFQLLSTSDLKNAQKLSYNMSIGSIPCHIHFKVRVCLPGIIILHESEKVSKAVLSEQGIRNWNHLFQF